MLESKAERARVGLCADCTWLRPVVSSRQQRFYLCGRAAVDDSLPKYPVLPVFACHGFERVDSVGSRSTSS